MANQPFSRLVKRKGIGLNTPNEGSSCIVTIRIESDENKTVDYVEIKHIIGEGDSQLWETVDACLEQMHAQEMCDLTVLPGTGYSAEDVEAWHITTLKSSLNLELELVSFERALDNWKRSNEEKLARAGHHKTKGTECFQTGKWLCAARRYSRALKCLITLKTGGISPEKVQQYESLKLSCYLNLAACQLNIGNYRHVIKNCTKVLQMDNNNTKALYRRGKAFTSINEFEKAEDDLKKVLQFQPNNKAVKEQLQVLQSKVRKQNMFYAKALSSMFGGDSSTSNQRDIKDDKPCLPSPDSSTTNDFQENHLSNLYSEKYHSSLSSDVSTDMESDDPEFDNN